MTFRILTTTIIVKIVTFCIKISLICYFQLKHLIKLSGFPCLSLVSNKLASFVNRVRGEKERLDIIKNLRNYTNFYIHYYQLKAQILEP
jgi:hypothetical protein